MSVKNRMRGVCRCADSLCANQANQICGGGACGPACNKENVECLAGPEYDNSRFVAQLRETTNGPGFCTAWVVAAPDIMLTNWHCSPSVGDVVAFNFECDACTNGSIKPVVTFTITQILACNSNQDWCIFRVSGNVAAQFGQATIDPSVVSVGQPIYEIHHAESQVKGYDDGQITGTFINVGSCPGNIQEHSVSVIASQAASGSPVFRSDNHCVTGVCNCGPPCSGGFILPMSTIWPNLSVAITNAGGSFQLCGQTGGCPPSDHDCFTTGGPGCTDADCCQLVCAQDPFCCETSWDAICVGAAEKLCPNCGSADAGDCCAANGTPFCNNAACCDAVCAVDPFCCDTEWDSICADGAATIPLCECGPPPPLCPQSDHNCFTTGGPGCTDEVCCNLICTQDPFCCETSWDGLCVDLANQLCTGCGQADAGDCCEANGTPFCNNRTCCDAVCAFDSFCCDVEWDSICADEAQKFPNECGCATPCVGDLNGDSVVDGADLGELLNSWGPCAGCPADLNGDDVVDGADLGILLNAWGTCP